MSSGMIMDVEADRLRELERRKYLKSPEYLTGKRIEQKLKRGGRVVFSAAEAKKLAGYVDNHTSEYGY